MEPPGQAQWRRRLFAGTLAAALVYGILAFLRPGTLRWDPYAIQDDARQFLLWMPRLTDGALLRHDLMADYWHSVSPPLYRLPFEIAAGLGADPVLFGRFLAIPLLLLAAWGAWNVALDLTGRPRAAFVTAAFAMGLLIHDDSLYTASPRAFGPPLLLLFLHGLLKEKPALLLISLFLLAALYPQPAIVALTMLALSRIRPGKPLRMDLSRRSILLVGGASILVAAAMLPFLLQTSHWGPVLTLAEARVMPNLMDPGARSTIVDEAGRIGWFCSWRMGFVPAVVPCGMGIPGAPLWNFLLLVPLLVFAGGALIGRPDPVSAGKNRVYLLALAAAAIWYIVAILLAFRLHLPSRYSQRLLELLEWIAIGQWLGLWIDRRLRAKPAAWGSRIAATLLGIAIILSFLSPVPGMKRPSDYALMRHIAALPKGSMIAGVSEDLNFVPALTGRAVLATPEHAIPYQLGYYRQIQQRLGASLLAVSTADQGVLRSILLGYRIDFLLVERAAIENGTIAGRYAHILPSEVRSARRRMLAARPALLSGLPACVHYRGPTLILFDAHCLAGARPGPREPALIR